MRDAVAILDIGAVWASHRPRACVIEATLGISVPLRTAGCRYTPWATVGVRPVGQRLVPWAADQLGS